MNDYLNCWKKYAVFAGRARRREYWMFVLFNILVSMGVGFVLGLIGGIIRVPEIALAAHLYTLAALIPGLAANAIAWLVLLFVAQLATGPVLSLMYDATGRRAGTAFGFNCLGLFTGSLI